MFGVLGTFWFPFVCVVIWLFCYVWRWLWLYGVVALVCGYDVVV